MKSLVRRPIFIAAVLVLGGALLMRALFIPEFESFRSGFRSSDRLLLDRHGETLDEIRVDKKVRRLEWVELSRISPHLIQAVLTAEDHRYFHHPGIDPLAMGSAVFQGFQSGKWRGASTIQMQVVGLLENNSRQRAGKGRLRVLFEKASESGLALLMGSKWSKAEALEAYLNLIPFRGEVQGIAAASHGLFDKAPYALTKTDAALLAVLIRSPNAKAEVVSRRVCALLDKMNERYSAERVQSVVQAALSKPYRIRSSRRMAPHVAQELLGRDRRNGFRQVSSSLDGRLQQFAADVLLRQVLKNQKQNMTDGAVVVLDNRTGEVLAYVGNIGANSRAKHVDGAKAYRQAGSTLKPFLFGKAIERKLITAATLLRDEPIEISVATGLYSPQNYDRNYREYVSVRGSLASSLNIPAVRVLELMGVDHFVKDLQNFGVRGLQRDEFYGPSLALGAADVTLWDLTNAYRALANGGVWSQASLVPVVETKPGARVMTEPAAYIISDILSDREARSLTFGLENMLSTRFWSAVKTGTSKDMRDNWTIGFSSKYTVGVWTGNFSGSAMWNVTGIHGAAPVWLEIMNYLHDRESSEAPPLPEGVVKREVKFRQSGQVVQEYFVAGTDSGEEVVPVAKEVRSRISYPQDLTMVAIDPDLADDRQVIFFQIRGPLQGLSLHLNEESLGPAKDFMPWKPRPGSFKLKLVNGNGEILHHVRFQVRGGSIAQR